MDYSVSVIQDLDVLLLKEFFSSPIQLVNSFTEAECFERFKLGACTWNIIQSDDDLVKFFDLALWGVFLTFVRKLFG